MARQLQSIKEQGKPTKEEFDEAVGIMEERIRTTRHLIGYWHDSVAARIKAARTNPDVYRLLCADVIHALQSEAPLRKEFRQWLIELLRGDFPEPIRRGRPKETDQHMTIVALVQELVDSDFNAARSNEKTGPQRSACDVVAKAVKNHKRFLKERSPDAYQYRGSSAQSYGQINKIWYARD